MLPVMLLILNVIGCCACVFVLSQPFISRAHTIGMTLLLVLQVLLAISNISKLGLL